MFKTILVHVDGGPGQDSRLRAAATLAAGFDAHLVGGGSTGMSMASYAVLNGSMAMPVSNREFQDLRNAAAAQLEAFREQAGRLGVERLEVRMVEDSARAGLLLQARYADLIVVSQETGGPASGERGLPQHLALHGPRPVLVVPQNYHGAALPGDAVIGWDGSMPAQRAIGAALPLLARAASVRLVLINPSEQPALNDGGPDDGSRNGSRNGSINGPASHAGNDMALYLARHGLRVEIVVERTRAPEGEALMELAHDCNAGLLVTGAFGHSRYREWLLGGVTRELLERAPAPHLIAH